MNSEIVIVGAGRMGNALLAGFQRANQRVSIAPKEAQAAGEAIATSSIVALAVPFGARKDVVDAYAEALAGKTVVDATNPLKFPGPEFDRGPQSGAEELQVWLPRSRVVKAFNTIFAPTMTAGDVGGERTSAFVASDDEDARKIVLQLARDMGFDAVDAGPLANADHLERLLFFEMMLEKLHGSAIGWRFLRPLPRAS